MNLDGTILLVEDNEDDVYFMHRALKAAGVTAPVRTVGNGRRALEYLQGAGEFADRAAHPLPRIVFLDLKIPYVHGLEVLAVIRGDPALRDLPVAVLTSSSEESDRNRARALGVLGYWVKPPTREMLLAILAMVPPSDAAAGAASGEQP